MVYEIEFAESVKAHLRSFSARERTIVFEAIEEQLVYEPLVETRNRKLMRPNPLTPWEVRISDLRVFYEVVAEIPKVVHILAIGCKE